MSFGQRLILLLQFSEQPHVLDRDDGLSGEHLEQRNLAFRERRSSVRRTLIVPIATPSFSSNGTLRIVRWPMRRAFSLTSGNSSVSLCMSAVCTVRRSRVARPLLVPRIRGSTG